MNPNDDNSGNDKSPYAQSATLAGTASVASGALVLDGNSDYLTFPDTASNSLFSRNELTLFAWFNVDTLDTTAQTIIAKYDDGNNNRAYMLRIEATSDTIRSFLSFGGTANNSDIETSETITPGTDYFVVTTWDGAHHKAFINGVEKTSEFYSGGIFDGNELVSIGASFNTTAEEFFDGTIYQAGVSGRAWSPQQIANLFHLGKTYRVIEPKKELLFSENFGGSNVLSQYIKSGGTFAIEYQNTTGKNYLKCLTGTSVTLKTLTNDWNGANFTDSQTTIAGSPTVTRNTSDVTITMSANDAITDIVVRRN
jgi:hypothetical protein|tara:strand:+ start:11567 stop:12496 length:930 start_codon:yes stop_codon:yes gene_type:complete